MTYKLKLYRQRKGAWSWTLENSAGGSASMGTYRSRSSCLAALGFAGYNPADITDVETYHWTGSRYELRESKKGATTL